MPSHQSLFIGITSDEDRSSKTIKSPRSLSIAIKKAGGIPLLLSSHIEKKQLKNLVQRLSGIVIAGGAFDIPPSYYGERKKQRIDAFQIERTIFELSLIREAILQKKPLLGICGGMQAINVALGGSLYQDIKAEIPQARDHEQKIKKSLPTHCINLLKNSKLCTMLKKNTIKVNSTHHQAIKGLGKNLLISAYADDGVIEAIESKNSSFILGVQWHPEVLKDQVSFRLFKEFVKRTKVENKCS